MKIIEKEFNALTGETTVTERDETAQELAAREAAEAKFAVEKAEAEAKATAKASILDRLGLTADELKTILG
jgi:hypothetical protein